MKKIVSFLLALTCVFALFSCDGDAKDFIKIVNASKPVKIITVTSMTEGTQTLKGRFETTVDGSDSETVYSYQRYATVQEGVAAGSDEYIVTEAGTVYYKDGKYSTDGENWVTEAPDAAAMQVKFSLSVKQLGKYKISKDGKILTSTITSAQAEKMLGVSIAADDGIQLTVQHDGTLLRSVSVVYATENFENVTITTSYTYTGAPAPEAPPAEEPGGEE